MTERLGPAVFVRQNNVERRDGRDVLRRLSCPLLIVCGENDALTPPEIHREMVDLVSGATLVIIPRCGHMTPIEDPRAVSMALRRWLLDEPSPPVLPRG